MFLAHPSLAAHNWQNAQLSERARPFGKILCYLWYAGDNCQ